MVCKKTRGIDQIEEFECTLIITPTDSIQQSDIYCLLKGTNKWMSARDVMLCLKGEIEDKTTLTKIRRMLKSLFKSKFLLKKKNEAAVWGHEFLFKFKR